MELRFSRGELAVNYCLNIVNGESLCGSGLVCRWKGANRPY
jgi:hypothetical protein